MTVYGIGVDLVRVERIRDLHTRYGERLAQRILAEAEMADSAAANDRDRFLAKRFAAKEALGKALGTGIRTPVLLRSIAVTHDDLGKPAFAYDDTLTAWMSARGLRAHLSLSDETEHALAFVVVERTENIA